MYVCYAYSQNTCPSGRLCEARPRSQDRALFLAEPLPPCRIPPLTSFSRAPAFAHVPQSPAEPTDDALHGQTVAKLVLGFLRLPDTLPRKPQIHRSLSLLFSHWTILFPGWEDVCSQSSSVKTNKQLALQRSSPSTVHKESLFKKYHSSNYKHCICVSYV